MASQPNGNWEARLTRKVTSQRAMLLALGFGMGGIILYVLPLLFSAIPLQLASVLQNVAFGLLFPAIFSAIWERSMTPALTDEIVAKIGLNRSVDEAGLQSVTVESDEDWERILGGAKCIEVYFDVDGSWWVGHRFVLEKAIARGCAVKAVVVDGGDAARRNLTQSLIGFEKRLQDEITTQIGFYLKLGADVRRSKQFPLASVIVVDDEMFIRVNRVTSYDPTFLGLGIKMRESLGTALRKELDEVWRQALAP